MAAALSVSVSLKNLKIAKGSKKMPLAITRGIKRAGLHLVGAEKRGYSRAPMKMQTGGILGSVRLRMIGLKSAVVGPTKVYSGWVEDGARSPHAPKTHKKSSFRGYKVIAKVAKAEQKKVTALISKEIMKVLK